MPHAGGKRITEISCIIAKIWRMVLLAALSLCLISCGRWGADTRVILTTGVHGDDVFRIDDSVCTKQEMLVYLLNAGRQYRQSLGGTEDEIKEYCLALVSQIKAMNLMAPTLGITLDDTDKEHAAAAATAYMAALSPEEVQALNQISENELEELYLELALAGKVYAYTIRDVNPEISDDEARTVTVEQIFVAKERPAGEQNGGETAAKERIEDAQARLAGGEDFTMLAGVYNEAPGDRVSFGRGETGDIPEEVAFNLETGEVSEIIETDKGFYLLRSVSSFDREQTRANKEVILEERRKQAFAGVYNAFAADLPVELNEELWAEMTVPDAEGQASYWTYYDLFFGE